MSDQVFRVPVSPAQRWVLLHLAQADGQMIRDRQRGIVFRRFMRAFALVAADEAGQKFGRVNSGLAKDRTAALFTLTAENLDYARGLADAPRLPSQESIVGPLFDALEEARDGRDLTHGAADYDASKEDWSPPTEPAE